MVEAIFTLPIALPFYGEVSQTANHLIVPIKYDTFHSSLLLSKLGPKAGTETRTKGPQSPKDRKCQDRANNSRAKACLNSKSNTMSLRRIQYMESESDSCKEHIEQLRKACGMIRHGNLEDL